MEPWFAMAMKMCIRDSFGFVDVVDVDGLEDLRLGEVPDAAFRHDGDGDGRLDALDHGRVAHAGHAAGRADVGRDALECHDGRSAGILGNAGLLGSGDVHDDAAFQHLGELAVEGYALGRGGGSSRVAGLVGGGGGFDHEDPSFRKRYERKSKG